jgi:hypothetical protein
MKDTTKLIRIKLTTWRELRKLIPGKRNETTADYLDRILHDLILDWSPWEVGK